MTGLERTLTELIIDEQRSVPEVTGTLIALVNDLRLACKRIAYLVGKGALADAHGPILDFQPISLHQRIGLVVGSRSEVERVERYHRDHNERPYDAPLFGTRGLFRTARTA